MPVGGRVTLNFNEAILAEITDGPTAVRLLTRVGEAGTQEAKRLCPLSPVGASDAGSGVLRSSIGWRLDSHGGHLVAKWGSDVDYALDVILGTRPHIIRSHGDYPLRNRAGQVFGREVHHPGTPAQDFLRPSVPVALRAV